MKGTIYKKDGKRRISRHYDQYVKSFDFDVERVFVNTHFGKTHVLVAGPPDGKPLFILQGGNCVNPVTLSWFLPLVDQYRVYAPDTIGHPGYSDETRISAKDHSFAQWIKDIMDQFEMDRSAFIGPSYGAGIILRLATFMPERIDCAVLVSPAGIALGSKFRMVKEILLPLMVYYMSSSPKYLDKIMDVMSDQRMGEMDKKTISDIFTFVKLEQEMPKITTKDELSRFHAPTLIIAGNKDIFFPAGKLGKAARQIIPNLVSFQTYEMGHFPSEEYIGKINHDILQFLQDHYSMKDEARKSI